MAELDAATETSETPEATTEETTPDESSEKETTEETSEESAEGEESASEDLEDIEADDEVGDDEAKTSAYADTTETRKKIEAKYPTLFKEFPEVRQALYQATQFKEVFPSVQDAREAADKAVALDRVSDSVMSGDPSVLFGSIAAQSPQALADFVGNILPTLHEKSAPLYLKAVDYGIKHLLNSAAKHGGTTNDKNLKLAAQYISNYMYGSPEIPALDARPTAPSQREKQLQEELKSRDAQTYRSFAETVEGEARPAALKILSEAIDPKNAMSPLVRRGLVNAAFEEIEDIVGNDRDHNARMVRLWKAAKQNGFSANSKPSIISAYLARVRQATASIRQKYRKDASSPVNAGGSKPIKKDIAGAAKTSSGGKLDPTKKINWDKTSDRDLMEGKITYK